MNTRLLGRAGIELTQLGLGGLFVSAFGGDYAQGCAATRRALELGIRYFDTAPTYANSEEVFGRALEGFDIPVVLSTKLGGRPQPFRPQDRACLLRSVEESLRLLGRDPIDILTTHEPDRPGQHDWWTVPVDHHGQALKLLNDLKRDGVIRATGLGGTTAYEDNPASV